MGLAERSLRTTSDGRVTSRHRLARRGTYGTDPEDANATASHRVDAPAGLEAYWDGLETTFKGKISGVGCMIGVSPNEHFACAGADHGLCGPKTWTRSRDATAAQRLELLDAFQLARVQAYRIGKLDARAGADEDADEDEDEPRAAARAASLKPEVPSVSAWNDSRIEPASTSTGCARSIPRISGGCRSTSSRRGRCLARRWTRRSWRGRPDARKSRSGDAPRRNAGNEIESSRGRDGSRASDRPSPARPPLPGLPLRRARWRWSRSRRLRGGTRTVPHPRGSSGAPNRTPSSSLPWFVRSSRAAPRILSSRGSRRAG